MSTKTAMKLNENALSILAALLHEPSTLETISDVLDKTEFQLRSNISKLTKDRLIYSMPKRCPITNSVLFALTDEGRKIINEKQGKEEAKPAEVEQPKVKPAITVPSPSMALLSEVNALQERLDDIAEALRETNVAMFETASGADKNLAEHIRTLSISYHAALDRAGKAEKTLAACESENRQADNRLDEWIDMASIFVANPENPEDLHAFVTKKLEAAMTEQSHHQNVAKAACSDLAKVSSALGIDPEKGGAEPILQSIADINSELIRLRAENVSLKTLNEAMPGFGVAHEEIKTMRRPGTSSTGIDGAISAKAGKITLFFDRRINASSVTLQRERLAKLIAVV